MPSRGAAGKERVSELAQATKKALAAALKELLGQKPFHKITISDITEQCGVNRMTFYYHFHDIYDLAQWAFQEERPPCWTAASAPKTGRTGFCPS